MVTYLWVGERHGKCVCVIEREIGMERETGWGGVVRGMEMRKGFEGGEI
jgi:hypothetical protein